MIVYGRLQPLIVTIASGALFMGIAMFLRPSPGGSVNGDLSDAVTTDLGTMFPPVADVPIVGLGAGLDGPARPYPAVRLAAVQ